MSKALIIVNAEITDTGQLILASPATNKMKAALRKAISINASQPIKVEVVANSSLWQMPEAVGNRGQKIVYCPLTIFLPDTFDFPYRDIFYACRQIQQRREWVETHLGYRVGKDDSWLGNFWLPVVMSAKGPIYGEVIGEGAIPNSFEQPIDLPDKQRQTLYSLTYQLLQALEAPPSVYLLQFGWQGKEVIFDRLWPFPAAPAIASIGVQEPDLFVCYWHCLTNQPILDISIIGT